MVGKICFLFPGQGSQYVGMGKFASTKSTKAQYLFEKADRFLGYSLSEIMFNGPEEKLRETSITQPALFLASAVALELVKDLGIKPSFMAGHSLGEYSALYAAGVLNFDQALRLVSERGKAMGEAGMANPGTMAAVLGLEISKIESICSQVSNNDLTCVPANYNSESQIVISGHRSAVQQAMELCVQAGAMKVIELNVSGAFHSPLMSLAVKRMNEVVADVPFTVACVPIITNVDATPTTDPYEFKRKLIEQIDHGVRWHESMKWLLESEVGTFIEVGSGKILSSLIKKLDRRKQIYCTDDFDVIENNLSVLSSI